LQGDNSLSLKILKDSYVRNLNEMFNKERPIENTVEINISYKEHRKRTEIDVIGGQV